ncbi:MAG: cell division protein FtsZ, partial [Erysipelotrichaceae bacterium]|nr:cell division protein FtsZ [Erysipelotrichaceae bacterium]
ITGGPNISLQDSSIAVDFIKEAAGNDIDIIYGVAINESLGEAIIVTVIATGFDLPSTQHTSAAAQTNLIFDRPSTNKEEEAGKDEVVTNNDDDDVPAFFKTMM